MYERLRRASKRNSDVLVSSKNGSSIKHGLESRLLAMNHIHRFVVSNAIKTL